jgi:hypothetical protein
MPFLTQNLKDEFTRLLRHRNFEGRRPPHTVSTESDFKTHSFLEITFFEM